MLSSIGQIYFQVFESGSSWQVLDGDPCARGDRGSWSPGLGQGRELLLCSRWPGREDTAGDVWPPQSSPVHRVEGVRVQGLTILTVKGRFFKGRT